MSVPSANAPALPPPGESWSAAPPPSNEGWSRQKFLFVLVVVIGCHLALVFIFGSKKQIVPRPLGRIPHLQLAASGDEFIALSDPTLFARPNLHDNVALFWRRMPPVVQPNFTYTEPPRYLVPAPGDLGAIFREFVRTNPVAEFSLNFKPEPKLLLPDQPSEEAAPAPSVMQITGELSQRRLLNTNALVLPPFPGTDVLAAGTVQALVDTAGNVASAVVLQTTGDINADQLALQLTQTLRFVPAPKLTFGTLTLSWRTVPTNPVAAPHP